MQRYLRKKFAPHSNSGIYNLLLQVVFFCFSFTPVLAQENHYFSKDFVFILPKENENNQFKIWNSNDKQSVLKTASLINESLRGFISVIAQDNPISCYRVKELESSRCTGSAPSLEKSFIVACVTQDGIYLPDQFFIQNRENQVRTFLHELIHLIDCGGLFSYSKKWIVSEWSTSYSTNRNISIFSKNYSADSLNRYNLSESLAETLATNFDCNSKKNRFKWKELFQPSIKAKLFQKHFVLGMKELSNNRMNSCILYLKKASEICPAAPLPYLYQSLCYLKLGESNRAKEVSSIALRLFEELEVPLGDSNFNLALICHVTALKKLCDYHGVIKITNRLLKQDPRNIQALIFQLEAYRLLRDFNKYTEIEMVLDSLVKLSDRTLNVNIRLKEELKLFRSDILKSLSGVDVILLPKS